MTSVPSPLRRPAGRPSRLSRAMVVDAARDLLQEEGMDNFSVNKLGKRLRASAMSLYTYFESRDALLEAVADDVFTSFEPPPEASDWRHFVIAWLEAITSHFRRYPVALSVIAWEGHLSSGWLRAWLPLVKVLAAVQPDTRRLSDALSWFSHAAMGFIHGRLSVPNRLGEFDEAVLAGFPDEDRFLLETVFHHHRERGDTWVLDFGFTQLVAGLEALLEGQPGGRMAMPLRP
ncbi:TetR/AcrR family transcriptional regulator [Sphingobium sp. WCS2017Hpa-17]|uniref:TetR/AcrR family transcriptional regulator n=1 Tax=Sphingobium sp. WCS2017Hpa-17 TaxID=3073638 RepID=UPI00288AFD66|nr:TetR/AcrR family transcriptional regulator [Sphingobium sp. WCS2017Hpa-17]